METVSWSLHKFFTYSNLKYCCQIGKYKKWKLLLSEGLVRLKEKAKKRKGRGFESEHVQREAIADYERIRNDDEDELEPGPQRCKLLLNPTNKTAE